MFLYTTHILNTFSQIALMLVSSERLWISSNLIATLHKYQDYDYKQLN